MRTSALSRTEGTAEGSTVNQVRTLTSWKLHFIGHDTAGQTLYMSKSCRNFHTLVLSRPLEFVVWEGTRMDRGFSCPTSPCLLVCE
jgi:hypothetical protein